jgi:hypothetical protein
MYVFLTFSADQFGGSGQAAGGEVGTWGADLAAMVAYTRCRKGIGSGNLKLRGVVVDMIRGKKRSNSIHPDRGRSISVCYSSRYRWKGV